MLAAIHQYSGVLILPLYFLVTLLIGWTVRKQSDSEAYLNASRSLSLSVVTAAYLAANCGALEVVGLSAMAAQYGAQAFHFYWIGAIPAMIFLALWMMPVYRRSGVTSVPQYLEFRYGPNLRLLNACVVGITILLLAGISLYAMAQVLEVIAGFTFMVSILLSAGVVLAYVLVGGIRATIYNEVFQLAVMIAGLVPLMIRSVRLSASDSFVHGGPRTHLWTATPVLSSASALDQVGIVVGLGFVLSFGYWCTDFVLMQRAFAVRTEADARQVPLLAGFGKLIFSFIVVLPGLAAYRILPELGHTRRFDQALPALMTVVYGPAMLGLGLTALAASLMSGLAANISAFTAIFTADLYRARWRRNETDAHYLWVARVCTVVAVLASMLTSFLNFFFSNLMEHVQLIFSIFGAPFWAIFLLGMGTRRTTERGALAGFLSGSGVALVHSLLVTFHIVNYGSRMSANFRVPIYAFCAASAVGWFASERPRDHEARKRFSLTFRFNRGSLAAGTWKLWVLSFLLLAACLGLNVFWR